MISKFLKPRKPNPTYIEATTTMLPWLTTLGINIRHKLFVPMLMLIVAFASCGKKIDCTDPPINIALISFTQAELDTIVIRKFTKDNNFQGLLDTLKIPSNVGGIFRSGDTTSISLYYPDNYIKSGFDWQIFLPAINRTISINNITQRDRTDKCMGFTECICYNEILTISVDDQIGTFETFPGFSSYNLYIRR